MCQDEEDLFMQKLNYAIDNEIKTTGNKIFDKSGFSFVVPEGYLAVPNTKSLGKDIPHYFFYLTEKGKYIEILIYSPTKESKFLDSLSNMGLNTNNIEEIESSSNEKGKYLQGVTLSAGYFINPKTLELTAFILRSSPELKNKASIDFKSTITSFNRGAEEKETTIKDETIQQTTLVTEHSTYVGDKYNIKVDYPNNWENLEHKTEPMIIFISSIKDKSQESVVITIEELLEPTTLDEYKEAILAQLEMRGFNLETQSTTEILKSPAYEIVFSGLIEQIEAKIKVLATIKNNNAYSITLTSSLQDYQTALEGYNIIKSSFELME